MATFPTPEPIEATVDIVGDVRVDASDRLDTVVVVEPNDPSKPGDVRAATQTTVECRDGRLHVRSPRSWRQYSPFGGNESVRVRIELPSGSRLEADSAMGQVTANGELGACRVKTSMGTIRLDRTGALTASTSFGTVTVDDIVGDAELTTGSGKIQVGTIEGGAVVRNSNGDTTIGRITGDLRIKASNGDIVVDHAEASASAKTACGNVRFAEVVEGAVVLETAAGEVEVGVREGTAVWLDVVTRFGTVRSSLDDATAPEPGVPTVQLRARTSAGDILVGRTPAARARAGRDS